MYISNNYAIQTPETPAVKPMIKQCLPEQHWFLLCTWIQRWPRCRRTKCLSKWRSDSFRRTREKAFRSRNCKPTRQPCAHELSAPRLLRGRRWTVLRRAVEWKRVTSCSDDCSSVNSTAVRLSSDPPAKKKEKLFLCRFIQIYFCTLFRNYE